MTYQADCQRGPSSSSGAFLEFRPTSGPQWSPVRGGQDHHFSFWQETARLTGKDDDVVRRHVDPRSRLRMSWMVRLHEMDVPGRKSVLAFGSAALVGPMSELLFGLLPTRPPAWEITEPRSFGYMNERALFAAYDAKRTSSIHGRTEREGAWTRFTGDGMIHEAARRELRLLLRCLHRLTGVWPFRAPVFVYYFSET